jgi:hypothetical protein
LISKEMLYFLYLPTIILLCNRMCENLYLYYIHTNVFYKSNFNIYFRFHILLKWNKWKFILDFSSKVYTYIINNHTKFQII